MKDQDRNLPPETVLWDAVAKRDAALAGRFVYAVKSTGIYCRPGCPSRTPRPENVEYFPDPAGAARAGYRPCLRCLPDGPGAPAADPRVLAACRAMEEAERMPDLAGLARAAGLDKRHFHRLFKNSLGVTPKQYADSLQLSRLRQSLSSGASVTSSLYDAGFGSPSRLYERAGKKLGMAPSAWRDGARGLSIRHALGACYLGLVLVAATEKGICSIDLGDREADLLQGLRRRFPGAELAPGGPDMDGLLRRVLSQMERPAGLADFPLHVRGTALQILVWQALRQIPPGQTATYAELAALLGRPKSARAVANAVAANPVAVLVPCHRVIGSGGGLGGYRWGLARKAALLEHEKAGEE